MSKEDKRARNAVTSAFIVLGVLMTMLSMTSCASGGYTSCAAYASSTQSAGCGR